MRVKAIFDAGADELERFTVITDTGDMLALSENGLGVNMWVGNCVDNYMYVSYGAGWRRTCAVDKVIRIELPRIIKQLTEEKMTGKRIQLSMMKREMQQLIHKRLN